MEKVRQIQLLHQLSEGDFLVELGLGMECLHEHMSQLEATAMMLFRSDSAWHEAGILGGLAEEEAAKFLMLLDAVRCPNRNVRVGHLTKDRFYGHLPRLLYAEAIRAQGIAQFGKLKKYLDEERQTHYADGPDRLAWVVYNRLLTIREAPLYVDYVEDSEGNRSWTRPLAWQGCAPSPACTLVKKMYECGFASPTALATIARVWRSVVLSDEMEFTDLYPLNVATLEALDVAGLLRSGDHQYILWRWPFPLYSVPLNAVDSDRIELRKVIDEHRHEEY